MDTQREPTLKISYSDAQLVKGINDHKGSQQRHFQNIFYDRYKGYVYKAATQRCRNFAEPEQLALDVTQVTFTRVFKLIKDFTFKDDTPPEEHPYILKAWIGKIAEHSFKKVYAEYVGGERVEKSVLEADEIICPLCGDFLDEDKKNYTCKKGHYKLKKGQTPIVKTNKEPAYTFDLFVALYDSDDAEVPNEFRAKLLTAMNSLSEREKDIVLRYADEGCLSSKNHLSDSSLNELCRIYETTQDNIKHIKNRALKKIKLICFESQ